MLWKLLKSLIILTIILGCHPASAISLKDLSCIAKMCLGGDNSHGQCHAPIQLVEHYERLGKKSWFLRQCPHKETDDAYAVQREQWRLSQSIEPLDPSNAPLGYQNQIQQRESNPQYLQLLDTHQQNVNASVKLVIGDSNSSGSQDGSSGLQLGGGISTLGNGSKSGPAEMAADELQSKIEMANLEALRSAQTAISEGGYRKGGANRSTGFTANNPTSQGTSMGSAAYARCQVYTLGAGLGSLSVVPLRGNAQSVPVAKVYQSAVQQRFCSKYLGQRLRVELFQRFAL